jgi:fructose-bisphosphate aldolase, class II
MRVPAIELLRAGYGRYAVAAFNVCNMEQMHGLFRGAERARAPVIVQFTRVMRDYAHPLMLEHLLRGAETIYPTVPFAVHHDHGDSSSCAQAIASGHYSSVMIDASHLPFEQNVALTRQIVVLAHAANLVVEAELGRLAGVEDDMPAEAKEAILTDPAKAEEFVERTGCDSLAVAIGTSHGAYKFSGAQRLRLDRLGAIQRRLEGFPLVLHGASSVPRREIERINRAGGAIGDSAGGVSETELALAVQRGVAKVNIGTDGRLLWTRVHREFFKERPQEFDFMLPGRAYVEEYAAFVAAKCQCLGSAGRAIERGCNDAIRASRLRAGFKDVAPASSPAGSSGLPPRHCH